MTRGATVWLTGLSGSGKSTIAELVRLKLAERGMRSVVLDGDDLRAGLNADLGMTMTDRDENVRRISEVAVLFCREGYVCVVAAISPREQARSRARALVEGAGHSFFEIYVDTPLEVCRSRDVKGLYRKATNGEIRDFTGLDSPYEVPTDPDFVVRGDGSDAGQNAEEVVTLVSTAFGS